MSLSIKICGMTQPDNIRAAIALRPDYLGLIFHRPSPRNALNLTPEMLDEVRGAMKFTGVFVDRPADEILTLTSAYRLHAVQLHGSENPEFCRNLRDHGLEVWKAVGIESRDDFDSLRDYIEAVDRFVFDKKSPRHGGTGRKFDWRLLDGYDLPVGFMLGGGIGPTDIAAVASINHPRLLGLDLNSRFETSPGVKSISLLDNFLRLLRNHEQNRQTF